MNAHSSNQKTPEAAADCVVRAASFLASCSRPALNVGGHSTMQELSSALSELVATAELFGSQPPFWRCAADAASLLGRDGDADTYRQRFADASAD